MISATSTALSALAAYGVKQAVIFHNVANIDTPDFKASSVVMQENPAGGVTPAISQGQDRVDISREAVDMLTTATAFKANLATLRAADEMTEEALKIKG